MPTPFTLNPLGPRIGAEALQLDLAGKLSEQTLQALEAALIKHEALVLHVPEMTPDQHLAIASHFGESEVHTFYPNLGGGYEQITVIDSKLGDRADMWHHDESFLPSTTTKPKAFVWRASGPWAIWAAWASTCQKNTAAWASVAWR